MRHEDDGIRPVAAVVAPDPELLPRASVIGDDQKTALVIGAIARHSEQDPPAATGTEAPGRAAIERRHSREQLEAPLLVSVPIEDDASRPALLIGHGRDDFVF